MGFPKQAANGADVRPNRNFVPPVRAPPRGDGDGKASKASSPTSSDGTTLQHLIGQLNSTRHDRGFKQQRRSVLQQLQQQTGQEGSQLLVSSRVFQDAVSQRYGGAAFAQRLFQSQNPDGAHEVPAERLVDALLALECATWEEHLRATYELCQQTSDGFLTTETLAEILQVAFAKLKLPVTQRQLRRVAEALLQDMHGSKKTQMQTLRGSTQAARLPKRAGTRLDDTVVLEAVRFEDFQELVQKYINNQKQQKSGRQETLVASRLEELYLRMSSFRHLPFWICFWVGMALAFMAGYLQNYDKVINAMTPEAHRFPASFPLAKAFAQVIQPLAFLLLFAVCRRTITVLRETPLRMLFPFDEIIGFHQICGGLLLLCALGHTFCHINNYIVIGNDVKPPLRWGSEVSITGYIMLAALAMGYLFAVSLPHHPERAPNKGFGALKNKFYDRLKVWRTKSALGRFSNDFTVFSVTHIAMWLVFYVMLIVHPVPGLPSQHHKHHSTTWIYVAVPLVLYTAERLWRLLRNVAFKADLLDVELISNECLPDGLRPTKDVPCVTVLRMRRPVDFSYRPGMYMFINVPEISRMEWHPFTISSAPGDPYISVHVKKVGNWTEKLYEHMSAYAATVEADLKQKLPDAEMAAVGSFQHGVTSPLGSVSLAQIRTAKRGSPQNGAARNGVPHQASKQVFTSAMPDIDARNKRNDIAQRTWLRHSAPKVTGMATFAPGAALEGLKPRTRASLASCTWEPLPGAPKVLLDGPFAAPSMRWEDYDVLVLAATGIAVTPFISVLADIVNKLEARQCMNCGHTQPGSQAAAAGNKKKIYFHWTVPDTVAPNYFASTLETIARDCKSDAVHVQIHMTGYKPDPKKPNLDEVFVKLGQEALQHRKGVDIVTGLQSKVLTTFGRPNWGDILVDVAHKNQGAVVGVFVCGLPAVCRGIQRAVKAFNATASRRIKGTSGTHADVEAGVALKGKTVFVYYQEYF